VKVGQQIKEEGTDMLTKRRRQLRKAVLWAAGLIVCSTGTMRELAVAHGEVEDGNRRAVQAGFDNWRSGAGSVYDLLASNAKWTIVGNSAASHTYQSRQEFLDKVIRPFNARLSSKLVPTVRAVYADGDWVIVLWDGIATARDGKPYKNTYSWFLQMREGQIVSAIAFYDSIAFNDLWTRVKPAP